MRPTLTPQQIREIQKLKKEGHSLYRITKLTHHSFNTIKKYLDTPIDDDISINAETTINEGSTDEDALVSTETPETPLQQNPANIKTEFEPETSAPPIRYNIPKVALTDHEEDIVKANTPPTVKDKPQSLDPFGPLQEAIVEVEGVPVSRKVQLTPKNLTMYGWFKKRYNWNGDLSDFIDDTMTYFFESKLGAQMQIIIKEAF